MEKNKRYFRIKYGYSASEFISIPEEYLAKAIYSFQKQTLFSFNDKIINGKEIKTITPNFHIHTGWNEWFEPKDAEDFKQIKRDCPDYTGIIESATKLAIEAQRTGNVSILSTPLSNNLIEGK